MIARGAYWTTVCFSFSLSSPAVPDIRADCSVCSDINPQLCSSTASSSPQNARRMQSTSILLGILPFPKLDLCTTAPSEALGFRNQPAHQRLSQAPILRYLHIAPVRTPVDYMPRQSLQSRHPRTLVRLRCAPFSMQVSQPMIQSLRIGALKPVSPFIFLPDES